MLYLHIHHSTPICFPEETEIDIEEGSTSRLFDQQLNFLATFTQQHSPFPQEELITLQKRWWKGNSRDYCIDKVTAIGVTLPILFGGAALFFPTDSVGEKLGVIAFGGVFGMIANGFGYWCNKIQAHDEDKQQDIASRMKERYSQLAHYLLRSYKAATPIVAQHISLEGNPELVLNIKETSKKILDNIPSLYKRFEEHFPQKQGYEMIHLLKQTTEHIVHQRPLYDPHLKNQEETIYNSRILQVWIQSEKYFAN